MAVAASLLREWGLVQTIEPLAAGRGLARALLAARDARNARRRRRARQADDPVAFSSNPAPLEVLDAGRLFKSDWHDCDVAFVSAR